MGFLGCTCQEILALGLFFVPPWLAGATSGGGGAGRTSRSTTREVLIGVSRKGVRWGLRVAHLPPLAPQRCGAGLRHLLCPHCRRVLSSLSPGRLLGERSPLHSALAVQREESFKRNPQKGELWKSWRCTYYAAPQARKGLLVSGLPRACPGPRRVHLAVRAAAPAEEGGLQWQTSLRSSEGNVILTCLCLRPPRANTPGHLARLHPFAVGVSERDSEEPKEAAAAAAASALREAEEFWGNLSAW